MLKVMDRLFNVKEFSSEIREQRSVMIQKFIVDVLRKTGKENIDFNDYSVLAIGTGQLCPERKALMKIGMPEENIIEVDETVPSSCFSGPNFHGQTRFQEYLSHHKKSFNLITQLRAYHPNREDMELIFQHLRDDGLYIWEEAETGSRLMRNTRYTKLKKDITEIFGENNVFTFKQNENRILVGKKPSES